MKFATVASALVFATFAAAQNPDPFIATPNGVTTCLTTSLTFGGTHPPFTITALPGGQASGTPIENIVSGTSDTSYAWLVNLDAGTYITLEIRDNAGNLQYSSPITVIAGTSTSCVGTTPSSSSSPSSSGAPTTSSTGSVASSVSSSVSLSTSAAVSTSSTASATSKASTTSAVSNASTASHTSTASATSTSGAATHLDAKFGVAGVLGLIGAALMV